MSTTSYEPGARVDGVIPLCVPEIGGNEWTYVKQCLDTGWVSSVGSYVTRFEEAAALACGTAHAVATTSGTAALHVALEVAGVRPDDIVLVSDLTFIAPANAIRYAGAHPVFIDADPANWQIDPLLVARFLDAECVRDRGELRERSSGRRVGALLPVDVLGHPCDLRPILEAGEKHGIPVVEDATESLGATYRGTAIGSAAAAACLSFNGNKLITTGGGGMIVTNDDAFAARARYLTTQAKDDPIEYVHGAVGYNYRLTNVQAAIGVAQIEQLDTFLAVKRANAKRYEAGLADVPGIGLMPESPWARSAFWLYTILVDEQRYGMSSRELLKRLAERGIQARPLWQPMHLSPAHAGERTYGGDVAQRLCRDALSLPSSVGLKPDQLDAVVRAIRDLAHA